MQEKLFGCPHCKQFTERTTFERPCADCDQTFHLMNEFGACPNCRLVHSVFTCSECGVVSNLAEWWTKESASALFRLFNGLAKIREAAGKALRLKQNRRHYVVDTSIQAGSLPPKQMGTGRKQKHLVITVCWRHDGRRMEKRYDVKSTVSLQLLLADFHPPEKGFLTGTAEWHMTSDQVNKVIEEINRIWSVIRRVKRTGADERILIWTSSPTDMEELVKVFREILSLPHFNAADFYLGYYHTRTNSAGKSGSKPKSPAPTKEDYIHFEVIGGPANRKTLHALTDGNMVTRMGYNMLFDFYRNLAGMQETSIKLLLTSAITGNRNLAVVRFSKSDFRDYLPFLLSWFEGQELYEKCQTALGLERVFSLDAGPEVPPAD